MDTSIAQLLEKRRYANPGDLINVLQEIQEARGFLSEEAIIETGRLLGISTTKIYGLATFYDQFRFVPLGKIHFKVCHGTTCYLSGSRKIVDILREGLGVEPGMTTKDGRFSFEITSCMGGCGKGPNIFVENNYVASVTPSMVATMIEKMKSIDNG